MVLHARVVLDLHEHLEQEISFQQIEGDFDSFQGKWLLEQLGSNHTLLKYSVESKMHKDTLLSEAIMEEVCNGQLGIQFVILFLLFIYFFISNGKYNILPNWYTNLRRIC